MSINEYEWIVYTFGVRKNLHVTWFVSLHDTHTTDTPCIQVKRVCTAIQIDKFPTKSERESETEIELE